MERRLGRTVHHAIIYRILNRICEPVCRQHVGESRNLLRLFFALCEGCTYRYLRCRHRKGILAVFFLCQRNFFAVLVGYRQLIQLIAFVRLYCESYRAAFGSALDGSGYRSVVSILHGHCVSRGGTAATGRRTSIGNRRFTVRNDKILLTVDRHFNFVIGIIFQRNRSAVSAHIRRQAVLQYGNGLSVFCCIERIFQSIVPYSVEDCFRSGFLRNCKFAESVRISKCRGVIITGVRDLCDIFVSFVLNVDIIR